MKLASAIAAIVIGFTGIAFAQDAYPSRAITIIVPFAGGSVPDSLTRMAAEHMKTVLNQPIIIDNRVGAGGSIGTAAGARAPADGYTITMLGSPAVLAQETMLTPGFDVLKDFKPIGRISNFVNVIVVNWKFDFKTIGDLVSYAKKNPGKLNFASSGPATPTDMGIQLFAKKHDIDIALVPYKASPAAVMAVVSGESDVSMLQAGAVLPHIKSGAMRALAVAAPKRWEVLPDVPNADEANAKVYIDGWIGLAAPLGTPDDRIAILNKALNESLAQPRMKEIGVTSGGGVLPGTPADLTRTIETDWASVKEAAAAAGVKKQ